MIQIKPLLDICGIVYSEKQLVLLQKSLLELLKKVVEKITSERKVLDKKRVETPPAERPEIHFIECRVCKKMSCEESKIIVYTGGPQIVLFLCPQGTVLLRKPYYLGTDLVLKSIFMTFGFSNSPFFAHFDQNYWFY